MILFAFHVSLTRLLLSLYLPVRIGEELRVSIVREMGERPGDTQRPKETKRRLRRDRGMGVLKEPDRAGDRQKDDSVEWEEAQ